MFQTKSLAVVVIKDHRMQIFRNEDFQDMFPICLHSVSLTGNSNDHDENFESSTYYCSTNRLAVTTRDIRVLKKKRFSNTRSVPGVVAGNATWQNTNTHTIATYLQITHYSKRD